MQQTSMEISMLTLLQDHLQYLDTINKKFEIHATVHINESNSAEVRAIPSYVNNHGILTGEEVQALLKKTKVC